jgi:hypothetical protein
MEQALSWIISVANSGLNYDFARDTLIRPNAVNMNVKL